MAEDEDADNLCARASVRGSRAELVEGRRVRQKGHLATARGSLVVSFHLKKLGTLSVDLSGVTTTRWVREGQGWIRLWHGHRT